MNRDKIEEKRKEKKRIISEYAWKMSENGKWKMENVKMGKLWLKSTK